MSDNIDSPMVPNAPQVVIPVEIPNTVPEARLADGTPDIQPAPAPDWEAEKARLEAEIAQLKDKNYTLIGEKREVQEKLRQARAQPADEPQPEDTPRYSKADQELVADIAERHKTAMERIRTLENEKILSGIIEGRGLDPDPTIAMLEKKFGRDAEFSQIPTADLEAAVETIVSNHRNLLIDLGGPNQPAMPTPASDTDEEGDAAKYKRLLEDKTGTAAYTDWYLNKGGREKVLSGVLTGG